MRTIINHLTVVFLFFFLIGELQSQIITQTLRGKVIDSENLSPLPFTNVSLPGTDPLLGTTTDIDGNFRIEKIPVGRHEVKASFIGYETTVMREIILNSAKETVIEIKLKESITSLGEIVIKATDKKESALNTMAIVSARQLSVEEASRYAGGFNDPARVAASFAGVAGNMGNNGIVIRGNAPRALLWRMEGVEIPNPNHFADILSFGAGGLTALSSQMLANSDFFTGAFPAEYGNALSGIMDLQLRSGNNQKREHTLQIGGIGLDASSEGPFKKGKRSSYLFNYRYSTLALLSPILPEDAQGTRYQDLAFKLNFPTKKAGTFSLWGLGADDVSQAEAETNSTLWTYDQDKEQQDSRQSMGAVGLNHKMILSEKSYLHTVLSASGNRVEVETKQMDSLIQLQPLEKIKNNNWKYTLSTYLNTKFSARHTNRTGIIVNNLNYNVQLRNAQKAGDSVLTVADEKGSAYFLQGYSQSKFDISQKLFLNIGFHFQYLTLTGKYSLEPRAGMSWNINDRNAFSFGYGLHSRIEMIGIYLSQQQNGSGIVQPNKNLDFAKAHHFVLAYDLQINEFTRFKIEPYYQILFNVPVVENTSFSLTNLDQNWFVNQTFANKGEGRNMGIDFTLERFVKKGFYYLFTTSIFDSQYKGGDGIWRSSRYNKNYIFNLTTGKEWNIGRQKQHIFSMNVRLTYQGGDRISPVDEQTTLALKEVIYDETKAFSEQKPNALLLHFTVNLQRNRPKFSGTWSLQILNILGNKEFYGYRYNHKTGTIDPFKEAILLPNISYKIQF